MSGTMRNIYYLKFLHTNSEAKTMTTSSWKKRDIREDRVIIYHLLRNSWKNRFGDGKQEVYFKFAKHTMFLQHWVVRAKKTPRGMSGLEIHTWKSTSTYMSVNAGRNLTCKPVWSTRRRRDGVQGLRSGSGGLTGKGEHRNLESKEGEQAGDCGILEAQGKWKPLISICRLNE